MLPEKKINHIAEHIQISQKEFEKSNYSHFAECLPIKEHWRAYKDFENKCCFLDIETTGLSKDRNKITTIGIYDGKESKVFINGQNLEEFSEEIKKYSMIVTFNGRCFDLPFISAKFPDVKFDQFHIDLRFVMKDLGYTGGLKRIEHEIGIARDDEIEGVDGYEAVRLWKRYEKGDEEALKTLVKYNIADVENLKTMMDMAFDKMKEKEFLNNI